MNDTPLARLDEADACHDDDPPRAADILRRLDPAALPAERLPGLAFLLNHVLGEKLGAWGEAHALFDALLRAAGEKPPLGLWRQAAAAARLAGDEAAATRLSAALTAASGAAAGQAQDVVALTAAMYRTPALPAAQAVEQLHAAACRFDAASWQAASPLDAAVAACANNLASGLLERPPADLQQAALRVALEDSARLAERFWLRAGNWVQHERAAYLRAMAANALGEAAQAHGHALRALALLDANDTERAEQVDRAFIELERARACRQLDLQDEARAAQEQADALAAQFNDAGLDAWYAKRRAELAAPARRAG
jgi:hypothetical protein